MQTSRTIVQGVEAHLQEPITMASKLEATKRCHCLIRYTFGRIPVHVHREKERKYTFEDTMGGKSKEVPDRIAEGTESERTGKSRGVDLLLTDEVSR